MLTLAFLFAMALEMAGGLVFGLGLIALGITATDDMVFVRVHAPELDHLGKAEVMGLAALAATIGLAVFIFGLSIAQRIILA
jgi:hypothetical protein